MQGAWRFVPVGAVRDWSSRRRLIAADAVGTRARK